MATRLKDEPDSQQCLNVLRYESYKLDPAEAVFLDWAIVNTKYFNFKEFYHTAKVVEKELRIGVSKQNAIIKKFEAMGFFKHIIKPNFNGMGKKRYIYVDFHALAEKKVLELLIDSKENPDYFNAYLNQMKYFAKVQKSGKVEEMREETIDENKHKADSLYCRLKDAYDNAIRLRIEDIKGDETGTSNLNLLKNTQLPRNPALEAQLLKANKIYDEKTLKHAFFALFNYILETKRQPENLILYFLTHRNDNTYPVIEKCLNLYRKFIAIYS